MNRKTVVGLGRGILFGLLAGFVYLALDSRVINWRMVLGVLVVGFLYWASWRARVKDAKRPLPRDFDSDDGIDWQETETSDQVFARSGALVLLVPDLAVHEADALCTRFKEAGVRFKLEQYHVAAQRSIPRFGWSGLAVRMRIWVWEDDLEKAKPLADAFLKITP